MQEKSRRTESDGSAVSKTSVSSTSSTAAIAAIKYAHQAEKLSYVAPDKDPDGSGTAIHAHFITPQDPIIVTSDGSRLPGVPLAEADKLNALKEEIDGEPVDVIGEASPVDKSEDGPRPVSPKDGETIQKVWGGVSEKSNATLSNESSVPTSPTLRSFLNYTQSSMLDF
jgi:hypothetical protein